MFVVSSVRLPISVHPLAGVTVGMVVPPFQVTWAISMSPAETGVADGIVKTSVFAPVETFVDPSCVWKLIGSITYGSGSFESSRRRVSHQPPAGRRVSDQRAPAGVTSRPEAERIATGSI